ncbi:MAG: capsular polysaccharide biosynthesis protein [Clostridia bacterium]|nr:capsular polysaccharide biosynthesis protein [Clostridia bacterium]
MEDKKPTRTQARKPAGRRDDYIDLMDLFGFYMSRLPLLIAAVLTGAVIAGLFTYFMIPNKFTATSRMYMVSASSDSVVNLADLNIGTSLSSDYVELMQTRPIVEDVIDQLGLDYSYEELLGMLSLSVVNNTRIVKISVTSTDPKEAMDIANQMAKTSKVELPKVMEAPTPTIAEMAVLPTRRSSPSLTKNVMLGSVSLLILTLVPLTVVYRMDDTVKTSEDLEKAFGIMPLSVIPEGRIEGLKKTHDGKDDADRPEPRELFRNRKRVRGGEARD